MRTHERPLRIAVALGIQVPPVIETHCTGVGRSFLDHSKTWVPARDAGERANRCSQRGDAIELATVGPLGELPVTTYTLEISDRC